MHVRRLGSPHQPPVLLLHGGGVAGWMWDPLIEQLGPAYRLLVPDLPGHDRSAEADYRSHEEALEELISLIEDERAGPVAAVGFSLGAQLAVLLAAHRPDLVTRSVVISAQAIPTRWPRATLALLRTTAPLMKSARFARAQAKQLFIPAALLDDYVRTSRTLSKRTLLASVGENIRFAIPEAWGTTPSEALVMIGGAEGPMMWRSAQLLARTRGEEHAEIIDGCGHGIPFQKPEGLARRLREWLQGAR